MCLVLAPNSTCPCLIEQDTLMRDNNRHPIEVFIMGQTITYKTYNKEKSIESDSIDFIFKRFRFPIATFAPWIHGAINFSLYRFFKRITT